MLETCDPPPLMRYTMRNVGASMLNIAKLPGSFCQAAVLYTGRMPLQSSGSASEPARLTRMRTTRQHRWDVPPSDMRFHDQDGLSRRNAGISGSSRAHVVRGRDQGVYNPILNVWVEPPANARMVHGLAFAPARLFSGPAPGKK